MTRRLAAMTLVLVVVLAGCSSGRRGPAAEQESFGVRMAKMDLWREAMFRFERAVELNPDDAKAHNNLAVAYEANGDFDAAAKAYREALRLDRSNEYIQKNYSRFVEFTTRDRRRQQQQQPRRPTAQTAAPAEEPADTPAAEPGDKPVEPASEEPVETSAPLPSSDQEPQPRQEPPSADPSPTAASPAEVPPPNPAPPPPTPNEPPVPPPGGHS